MSFLKESQSVIQASKEAEEAVKRQKEEAARSLERWQAECSNFVAKEAPAYLEKWHKLGLSEIVWDVQRTIFPKEYFERGIVHVGGGRVVGLLRDRNQWVWSPDANEELVWKMGGHSLREALSVCEPHWPDVGILPSIYVTGGIYVVERWEGTKGWDGDLIVSFTRTPLFALKLDLDTVLLQVQDQSDYSVPTSSPDLKRILEKETDSRIAAHLRHRG